MGTVSSVAELKHIFRRKRSQIEEFKPRATIRDNDLEDGESADAVKTQHKQCCTWPAWDDSLLGLVAKKGAGGLDI